MASRDVELLAAEITERSIRHDHEAGQAASTSSEQDALGTKRAKLLQTVCVTSMVTVIISICSILTGVWAITTYASTSASGIMICGGVISGGMALLLTICPFCMYHEGKKTTRGNKLGALYMCNLYCMVISYAFVMCGILMVLGISGIWGTVECIRAKQKVYISTNMCLENTDARLTITLVTLITSGLLFILTTAIMCIFCNNTTAFGYKTLRKRNAEFYDNIRREAREEALREVAEINAHRHIQSDQTSSNRRLEQNRDVRYHPAYQIDDKRHPPYLRGDKRRSPSPRGHNRHRAQPSAPPFAVVDIEEPPPSYDEVICKEVK